LEQDLDPVFDVDDYLYFYDETLTLERTVDQVDFLVRELALPPKARVLDLGCGHGRHANELSRRGYDVLGLDRTAGFLAHAQAVATREALRVKYIHTDMRALAYDTELRGVVSLFDAFGYLSDEENASVLTAVGRALVPGASFCLDIRNRDFVARNLQPTAVLRKDDDLMIDQHSFDVETGRLHDDRIIVRGGRVRHTPFSIRLYTFNEIASLMRAAGLLIRSVYGDFEGSALTIDHDRMVIFATRP
jgi:SAM-dependent methyltransferase